MDDVLIYLTNKMSSKEIIIMTILLIIYVVIRGVLSYKNNKLLSSEKEYQQELQTNTELYRNRLSDQLTECNQQLEILTNEYNDHVSNIQATDIVNTHVMLSKHVFIALVHDALEDCNSKEIMKEDIIQTIDVRKNNDNNALDLYKYKGQSLTELYDNQIYDEITNLAINCVIKKEISYDQFKHTLKLSCKQSMNEFADKLNKIQS